MSLLSHRLPISSSLRPLFLALLFLVFGACSANDTTTGQPDLARLDGFSPGTELPSQPEARVDFVADAPPLDLPTTDLGADNEDHPSTASLIEYVFYDKLMT